MSNIVQFIDNRQFHKRNYEKAIEFILPKLYYESDYSANEKDLDIVDQIINTHLQVIGNISSVIPISAIPGTVYSSINTASGISQFFIKQNNLTNIDINEFEKKILIPLGKSFRDFESVDDFSNYLSGTLLPGITLNNPSLDFLNGGNVSSNHNYLITNLSWLYFLNFASGTYDPSSYVLDLLVNKTYVGDPILLNDGIKGLTEYIWKTYENTPAWESLRLLPSDYRPPSFTTDDQYTSGTQQLDKLKTLIDVVYSPLYIDNSDVRVRDAITIYLSTRDLLNEKVLTGPFIKLIKALSFAFADYSDSVDKLETLYDIDKCPAEYLPLMANLIGWELFGSDPERWRLQIVNAVNVYKRAGTRQSLQYAIDAVFSQDVFDIDSKIFELWESYVPHLIYYALATESEHLINFDTWTIEKSRNLNIPRRSTSSMDENIRLCTDRIIYELAMEFSSSFILSGQPFPLNDPNFKFYYRGSLNNIPPFEEYPYYVDTHVSYNMVSAIADKLVCFGVPKSFAFEVAGYIRDNCLEATDDIRNDNTWLMFTSGVQYPSNWNSVISEISNNKIQYLPLWNGKSSHFKVIFEANQFDFTKNSLEVDSKFALQIASRITREFSPAHSIPIVTADINASDVATVSSVDLQLVTLDKVDNPMLSSTSSISLSRYALSAAFTGRYKRQIASSLPEFKRGDIDSMIDPLMANQSVSIIPRRNHRRRDLRFTLPKHGFYTRTGFNMPVTFEVSTNTSSFFPLGYNPLTNDYVAVSDVHSLPNLYRYCEKPTSVNSYFGFPVSSMFPCRGWRGLGSNKKLAFSSADKYHDRGQLDPVVATIHYIKEKAKDQEASAYYAGNLSALTRYSNWKNVIQSYSNSSTEFSGNFPNLFSDYIKNPFGREFQKLFNTYTSNFGRHKLIPSILNLDGPTIFAHAFGSIIRNSKFEENGPTTQIYQDLISSSLQNIVELKNNSIYFNATATNSYVASSTSDVYLGTYEFRNYGILKNIELCQTSGSSDSNNFSIIRINESNKYLSDLLKNKTFIKQTQTNGFGRVIFDLSKYSNSTEDGYEVSTNFLSPEHEFNLKLKVLLVCARGYTGGGGVGIWIHTKPENGKMWTFNKESKWVQHDSLFIEDAAIADLMKNYLHAQSFPIVVRSPIEDPTIRLNCLSIEGKLPESNILNFLDESEFTELSINFNTFNRPVPVDEDYYKNSGEQLHRFNQNYVIELIPMVFDQERTILYTDVNLTDLTLNKWTKPLILSSSGIDYRVDLNKQQVYTIIKYFNKLAGAYNNFGYGSRIASQTSGIYETSGGSKLTYIESPDWYGPTKATGDLITSISFIN